jgi:hypothetical protein
MKIPRKGSVPLCGSWYYRYPKCPDPNIIPTTYTSDGATAMPPLCGVSEFTVSEMLSLSGTNWKENCCFNLGSGVMPNVVGGTTTLTDVLVGAQGSASGILEFIPTEAGGSQNPTYPYNVLNFGGWGGQSDGCTSQKWTDASATTISQNADKIIKFCLGAKYTCLSFDIEGVDTTWTEASYIKMTTPFQGKLSVIFTVPGFGVGKGQGGMQWFTKKCADLTDYVCPMYYSTGNDTYWRNLVKAKAGICGPASGASDNAKVSADPPYDATIIKNGILYPRSDTDKTKLGPGWTGVYGFKAEQICLGVSFQKTLADKIGDVFGHKGPDPVKDILTPLCSGSSAVAKGGINRWKTYSSRDDGVSACKALFADPGKASWEVPSMCTPYQY